MATPRRSDENIPIGADTRPFEKGFGRLVSSTRAQLAALAAFAAGTLARIGAELVALYRVQERAEIRLQRALQATGQYTAQVQRNLVDVATRVQRLTTIGDEEVLGLMARLVQMGRVAESSLEGAVTGIVGLARAQGRGVERVSRTVINALAQVRNEATKSLGTFDQLLPEHSQYLRNLKETEGGARAAEEALRLLNETYGNQAAAVAGSTDELEQAKNLWGDLREVLGQVVYRAILPLVRALNDVRDASGDLVAKGGISKLIDAVRWLDHTVRSTLNSFELLGLELELLLTKGDRAITEFLPWLAAGKTVEDYDAKIAALTDRIKQVDRAYWRMQRTFERGAVPELPDHPDRRPGRVPAGTEDVESEAEREAAARAAERAERERRMREARMAAHRRETELLEMELARREEVERSYFSDIYALENQANLARIRLGDEASRAELEQVLRNIELKRAARTAEYNRELEAIRVAGEAERAERERVFTEEMVQWWAHQNRRAEAAREAKDYERILGRELDALDLEYLAANLTTREGIEREFRERQIEESIAARREEIENELRYGRSKAALLARFNSANLTNTGKFFAHMATLQTSGNKRLAGIGKAAAKAKLLLDLATKPIEAYAKTSAAYPAPWGNILGAAHAAAIASALGTALGRVGGGGGAGGVPAGGGAEAPPTGGVATGPERSEPQTVVHRVTVLEVDGRTLAEVVEAEREHSDLG